MTGQRYDRDCLLYEAEEAERRTQVCLAAGQEPDFSRSERSLAYFDYMDGTFDEDDLRYKAALDSVGGLEIDQKSLHIGATIRALAPALDGLSSLGVSLENLARLSFFGLTISSGLRETDLPILDQILEASYGDYDTGWVGVLQRRLRADMVDPNVQFTALYTGDDLIGVVKINTETAYMGTLYVMDPFKEHFQIGRLLQGLASRSAPGGLPIHGTVSVHNSALARHLSVGGVLATALCYESDGIGSSGPLFRLEQVSSATLSTNSNETLNILIDSSPKNSANFVAEMQKLFSQNYVLIRVDYEKTADGRPDLSRARFYFCKRVAAQNPADNER